MINEELWEIQQKVNKQFSGLIQLSGKRLKAIESLMRELSKLKIKSIN